MKILYINDYWIWGGAEEILRYLYSYFNKDHIVSCLVKNNENMPFVKGYKFTNFDEFDIIHFHNINSFGIEILHKVIDSKVPYVITCHDYWLVCKNRMRLMGKKSCNAISFDDCQYCVKNMINYLNPLELHRMLKNSLITVPSKYQLNILHNYDYNKLVCIKNGIDVSKFYNSNKQNYVLYFGVDYWWKGRYYYNKLRSELNWMIPFKDSLSTLTTRVSDEYRSKLYSNSLCLILPVAWDEPCGLTHLEARASGKPVIAFDRGGISEYKTDGLILVDTYEDFKYQLLDLIHNKNMAHKLGIKAMNQVRNNYNHIKMCEEYEKLYHSIL